METQARVTQNTFCTYTGSADETETTLFFISGNPGLVGYYYPFLSLLAEYLGCPTGDYDSGRVSYQIYGCSLGGFEVDEDAGVRISVKSGSQPASHGLAEKNTTRNSSARLYNLEDQIRFVQGKLTALMHEINANAQKPPRKRKVVLMGHSVGAYIAMEVVRRHREASSNMNCRAHPGSDSVEESHAAHPVDFDIVGGVMLFPTVVDIAHSPSGQKLTALLSLIPHLALVVGFLARILTTIFPAAALRTLIRSFMKDPPTHALDTTYTFLTSPGGVRQAIHMAADEMRTITSDKWADDIWGVATAKEPITKMFFYFGRNDHWVAEKSRDQIIRCRDGTGPRMFVCEDGLPHAFCLKHSDVMARKVAGMIREIGCS